MNKKQKRKKNAITINNSPGGRMRFMNEDLSYPTTKKKCKSVYQKNVYDRNLNQIVFTWMHLRFVRQFSQILDFIELRSYEEVLTVSSIFSDRDSLLRFSTFSGQYWPKCVRVKGLCKDTENL